MSNHYQTLGVPIFSSAKDVQKAFRALAIQYHPDKHGGSEWHENKFKEINAAYQVLNDALTKQKYDDLLSYGSQARTQTTTPPNYYAQNVSKQQQYNRPQQKTYKRKPAPKLEFTEFQKVYAKVSLGVVVLFLVLISISHLLNKNASSKEQLATINQHLKTKTILYTQKGEFLEASKQLDSISMFGGNNRLRRELASGLLKQIENKAKELYIAKNYKESLTQYIYLEQFSKKYEQDFSYTNKIRIICLLLVNNDLSQLNERITAIKKQKIDSFESAFALMNMLLEYQQIALAEDVSNVFIPKFLEGMQAIYGPLYRDILATKESNTQVIPALFQYLVLNKNGQNENKLFMLEDLLEDMIKDENQRKVFTKLSSIDFNKNGLKSIVWTNEEIQELNKLGLKTYFFSL